ncbi:MAG: hypothetical protein ACI9FN_002809 [Saprospiraceae bacterium]|jgi:hypothetical protein
MCRLTITVVSLFILFVSLSANSDVQLRLQPNLYDPASNSVYVNVEIKYDGTGEFVLADQNYRIYYDASSLQFDTKYSNSDLPSDLYSDILIHELLENVPADKVNQLKFDKNLGFLNFSINLSNNFTGGIKIKPSHGWERVAILRFQLAPNQDPADIVWSRNGTTNKYATAFVQIMEWLGPNNTELAEISEFTDTSVADYRAPQISKVVLAPNPAIDFVKVTLDAQALDKVGVVIRNAIGQSVYKTSMIRGSKLLQIPLSDLIGGTYTLEAMDKATGRKFTEAFIKVGT